jgi:putative nucleotidyltransferase with HDIG domain
MSDEKEITEVDLLDSTYPLLKEFRKKCPGTYKHSQTIVSMVEAVAMDLSLDITSMKIRAMYHDIGKMLNPQYFSENQGDSNPHDEMSPEMSYQIITRHVSDSVMILINDGNFPREIIESISRHHGKSLLKPFFVKSGENDENIYRYKTSLPQNVEDLILMIIDCAEASTRSLAQNSRLDDVSSHVDTIVQNLMDDGQLNDVTMKIGDLTQIKSTLKSELGGLYQKRVDYEDESKEEE